MSDLKKILNPVARVGQAVAPFLAFTPAGPAGALAATLFFSSVAQATAATPNVGGAVQAAAIAAVAGAAASGAISTPRPGAERPEFLEANSALQVAAMAAGVDVTEAEARAINRDLSAPLRSAARTAEDAEFMRSSSWNPRFLSASQLSASGAIGAEGRLHQMNGNLGFMANGIMQGIFSALAPELRGLNSTLAQTLPLMLGAGLPALLRATGAVEYGAPRPLERLIAGTVLGPRQMGAGMVASYYNNPSAVRGHMESQRAAASGAFLQAVGRARVSG